MMNKIDTSRNIARNVLYALTKLPYESCAVFLLPNNKLLYMKRADSWDEKSKSIATNYYDAHTKIIEFMMSSFNANTTIGNYPRIFKLAITNNSFLNRWKIRKIYCGKLPEYKG